MLKTFELTISFVKEDHIFSSILSFSIVGEIFRVSVTMAKTEIIYPKNVGASVAMNFI